MSPWVAKSIILVTSVLLIAIPAFVHRNEVKNKTSKNFKGPSERILLALVSLAFCLALIWVATPVFAFADYPFHEAACIGGLACLSLGLWLLYRSHKDLGPNWSLTLEINPKHELITHGIYQHVRHPMYLALLLYGFGQALVVPNWLAGPSYLIAVILLVGLRMRPEERMLAEEFRNDFETYAANTKRLIPRIW